MSKVYWCIEEEKIVCKFYLENQDCSTAAARYVVSQLVEAGFEERSATSVRAKLSDYNKIHTLGDLDHVASNSIKVYLEMNRNHERCFEGLSQYLSQTFDSNGKVINSVKNANFTYDTQIMNRFECNPITTIGFDEYFNNLRMNYDKDSDIYNPAHHQNTAIISRKLFSKVVNGECRTKDNLLKLAILMHLDLKTTVEFLSLEGHAFNRSDKRDAIIIYAIEHKYYDHMELDITLWEHKCELLFYPKRKK